LSPERNKYIFHALVAPGAVPIPSQASHLFLYIRWLYSTTELKEYAFARDANGHIPLHICIIQRHLYHVPHLLDIAPATVKTPTSAGKYPLHLAIRKGGLRWPWYSGLGRIVEGYKPVLAIRGRYGKYLLYPYQQAARCDAPVDTIYRLLRERPDLLAQGRIFKT
jgi:hypothetical protein